MIRNGWFKQGTGDWKSRSQHSAAGEMLLFKVQVGTHSLDFPALASATTRIVPRPVALSSRAGDRSRQEAVPRPPNGKGIRKVANHNLKLPLNGLSSTMYNELFL